MEGKRFGIGLAAGLLLALLVVSASGGLGSVTGTFLPAPAGNSEGLAATSTASFTVSLTTSSVSSATPTSTQSSVFYETTTQSASNTLGTVAATVSGATSSASASTSTISSAPTASSSSTTSQSIPQSMQNGGTGNASANTPGYSSNIYSIAHQPAVSDAVIFIPVLVAFLLGAVLYRFSIREKEAPGTEQKKR